MTAQLIKVIHFQVDHLLLLFSSSAVDEKVLADAIRMTNIAVNLCLSNKFFQAQAKLEPW